MIAGDPEYNALCQRAEVLMGKIINDEFDLMIDDSDQHVCAARAAKRIWDCVEGMIETFATRCAAAEERVRELEQQSRDRD
jgi:hypothetical protein